MKCPRYGYIVVSEQAQAQTTQHTLYVREKDAQRIADGKNKIADLGVKDWRIEKFNKGD